MHTDKPLQLLGGISPQTFMRRYWHKKPLVVRQALPGFTSFLSRTDLVDMAAQEDVESRLVVQADALKKRAWQLRRGPLKRSAIPPFRQSGWTVLVQGVDLHDERAHQLIQQFRFIPDARLDDLMISYATDTGGVGPHFDNYDVFLLQAHGKRRWRIGRQKDKSLLPDLPLKILANFVPEQEFVLEPGDMLYLPPGWAHDGIAEGECMTYSVGFRSPSKAELAREILQRVADDAGDTISEAVYRDPSQEAVQKSAELPKGFVEFARQSMEEALRDPLAVARSLGEYLSEPKANVWFDSCQASLSGEVHLDRRTRMLYDEKHVFINGESFLAGGMDAKIMKILANERALDTAQIARLSEAAKELLQDWCSAGWVHSA